MYPILHQSMHQFVPNFAPSMHQSMEGPGTCSKSQSSSQNSNPGSLMPLWALKPSMRGSSCPPHCRGRKTLMGADAEDLSLVNVLASNLVCPASAPGPSDRAVLWGLAGRGVLPRGAPAWLWADKEPNRVRDPQQQTGERRTRSKEGR